MATDSAALPYSSEMQKVWLFITKLLVQTTVQVNNAFQTPYSVLLKYGRPVAKCDPRIHRATQGPTTDGPFGDQWIL